jgi:FkbM family methyltransferase
MELFKRLLRGAVRTYVQKSPIVRGQGRIVHGWRALWKGEHALATIAPGLRMNLDLSDLVQREIYFAGVIEADLVGFMREFLVPGMHVVDAGANVGFFTLLASQLVGAEGRVHAFEPAALTFQHLQENIRLNDLQNVTAERVALSDHAGEAPFFAEEGENWGRSSLAKIAGAGLPQIIPLQTLDCYLEQARVETVDFIKLDTEGAELAVLQGASRLLSTRPPKHIVCELNFVTCRRFGYHPSEIVSLLEGYGYRAFRLGADRPSLPPLRDLEAGLGEAHVDALFSLA